MLQKFKKHVFYINLGHYILSIYFTTKFAAFFQHEFGGAAGDAAFRKGLKYIYMIYISRPAALLCDLNNCATESEYDLTAVFNSWRHHHQEGKAGVCARRGVPWDIERSYDIGIDCAFIFLFRAVTLSKVYSAGCAV